MTREEAKSIISNIDKAYRTFSKEEIQALEKAITVLEQKSCEDAISREAVQNYVESHIQEINTGYGDLNKHTNEILRMIVDYIEKMESVTPQPEKRTEERTETHACDCISRKAVLKQLKGCLTGGKTEYNYVKLHIDSIPPVTPKPKTGHWINIEDRTDWYDAAYKCSCCGREIITPYELKDNLYSDYPYCHCGAKMESENKE